MDVPQITNGCQSGKILFAKPDEPYQLDHQRRMPNISPFAPATVRPAKEAFYITEAKNLTQSLPIQPRLVRGHVIQT